MTRIIICLIIGSFSISNLLAQTYYYNSTKTFNENGYIYQCDVATYKLVSLYNKTNPYVNTEWGYKAGGTPTIQESLNLEDLEEDDWTRQKAESIINTKLAAYKSNLSGYKLETTMYIDSSTGKVVGTMFNFITTSPFATIPVSVYRQMELSLIENIYFTPTSKGKEMNYLIRTWLQEVE